MRVLIAEDDPVSRTILCRAVARLGHECLTSGDGAEAWALYRSSPEVDVLISDWMMPEMDGAELCRRVRGLGRDGGYTYFVFLTAFDDKDHLLAGLEAGADDYLTKPLDRAELGIRLIAASRVTTLHRRLGEKNAELERLNKMLFEQARRDPLTGLSNRLQLREDLEVLKARVERYGHSYCVILCDVDFFKLYNDGYGHQAGDEVLVRVAATIENRRRKGDAAYRYGGEEFLVILPEQSLGSATVAAEGLREVIEGLAIPHEAKTPPGVVTLSLGVAELSPGSRKSVGGLLREADAALYRAKESGRNRVAVHEPVADAARPRGA